MSAPASQIDTVRLPAEIAQDRSHEKRGFAQVAVVRIGLGVSTRLGVEQDGADHRAHVAAHALAVVVENRGDAGDVLR
jgi:hypothetical protein